MTLNACASLSILLVSALLSRSFSHHAYTTDSKRKRGKRMRLMFRSFLNFAPNATPHTTSTLPLKLLQNPTTGSNKNPISISLTRYTKCQSVFCNSVKVLALRGRKATVSRCSTNQTGRGQFLRNLRISPILHPKRRRETRDAASKMYLHADKRVERLASLFRSLLANVTF